MPRTLIAVPSVGLNDFRFTLAFASMKKPPQTGITGVMRSPVDAARNEMAKQAVLMEYDYVFFLDDDMIPPPPTLEALVAGLEARPELAALCAMAYRRKPPHWPCVMKLESVLPWPRHEPLDSGPRGIEEVRSITFAACLVRTSVFKDIEYPWFEFKYIDGELVGEDIILSKKMKDAGMRLGCDTSVEVGHISESSIVGRKEWESYREKMREVVERPRRAR